MLWIHLQVTKRSADFNHAELEESTYYQYSYGSSKDLTKQAARFVAGFKEKAPFAEASVACAFVGLLSFLELNGKSLHLDDAGGVAFMARCNSSTAEAELSRSIEDLHEHAHSHNPDVRGTISRVIRRYPQTIAALVNPIAA